MTLRSLEAQVRHALQHAPPTDEALSRLIQQHLPTTTLDLVRMLADELAVNETALFDLCIAAVADHLTVQLQRHVPGGDLDTPRKETT
jgi:hypothetical protein